MKAKIININVSDLFKENFNNQIEIYNKLLDNPEYIRYQPDEAESEIHRIIKINNGIYFNDIGIVKSEDNLIINDSQRLLIIDLKSKNKIMFNSRFNEVIFFDAKEKKYNQKEGFIIVDNEYKANVDMHNVACLSKKNNIEKKYEKVLSYYPQENEIMMSQNLFFEKILEKDQQCTQIYLLENFYDMFKKNKLEIKIPQNAIDRENKKSGLSKLIDLSLNKKPYDINGLPIIYSLSDFEDFIKINKDSLDMINVLYDKNIESNYYNCLNNAKIIISFHEEYKNLYHNNVFLSREIFKNKEIYSVINDKIWINVNPHYSRKEEMEYYDTVTYLNENKIIESAFKDIAEIKNFKIIKTDNKYKNKI